MAKKPPGCLEYIVVHELIHLLEPTPTSASEPLCARSCRSGKSGGLSYTNCL
ncbi:YgjP-like metallopeptidase domain-containing protein [Achromobacter spanius]|uniref:YgjP-like metallopeptidase domain-containing protein n=1 Tax=Achromobacter spanius TaxID=217203 RepID=UPI0036E747A6